MLVQFRRRRQIPRAAVRLRGTFSSVRRAMRTLRGCGRSGWAVARAIPSAVWGAVLVVALACLAFCYAIDLGDAPPPSTSISAIEGPADAAPDMTDAPPPLSELYRNQAGQGSQVSRPRIEPNASPVRYQAGQGSSNTGNAATQGRR